jgi:predicted permease
LLVVVDLALALVLLASAGVMLRTVGALMRTEPGFDPSRVLTLQFTVTGSKFNSDEAILAFQQRALDAIRAVPGVERAALAGQIPFARAAGGSGDCWAFHPDGRMKPNPSDDPCVERFGITPDYLSVMQVPLLAGRGFTPADTPAAQPVILVSESTARAVWGSSNPLGARVRIGRSATGRWWTVVGVVADVHFDDLAVPVAPAMYTPEPQIPSAYLTAVVKASAGDGSRLAGPVRGALRQLDSTVPVHAVAPLSALVQRSAAQRRFVMQLLAGFAGVAVLLAAIGLYGVVAYRVTQRTREVGVRIALGARPRDVARLVLSDGLQLVALGELAGLAGAAACTRLLGTLVFGVSPVDPASFAAAAGVLAAVALLAQYLPVRRALRIDPARALRAE